MAKQILKKSIMRKLYLNWRVLSPMVNQRLFSVMPKIVPIFSSLSFLESSCVWRFTMSEGDFKASDITLGRAFNLHSVDFVVDFIPHKPQPFTVPPHICGALFHTPAGRAIMKDSIQFVDMCNVMMNKTSEREEKIKDRRAALWSLAHIAVKPKGVLYLEV